MKPYDGYAPKDRFWDFVKFLFWLSVDLFLIGLGYKSFRGFFH